MPVDPLAFRRAMGRFATGVTIVTALADGVHHAMTANSFTSVSLDPVLVLVSVEKASRFHDVVLQGQVYGVSVLTSRQEALSRWFANRARPADERQFEGYPHHLGEATGVVLFDDTLASLECVVHEAHDAGDHTLVVGEVAALEVGDTGDGPLLYLDGTYITLAP